MKSYPRYHVATGTYIISEKKPLILEAFLGTCVGVALFDRSADIGGLMHILLPQPASEELPEDPEKYASTGLPIFIKAMEQAGASRQNMQAWIAGGALVEPLTQQDFALDIGGRTAEIVQSILSQNGIMIDNAETGGFFTCSISLDLDSWQSRIMPAGVEKGTAEFDATPPSEQDIEKAIQTIQPIPQVALKVLRIINEDMYNFKEIAAEVRKDQVISAKTLQLCNSAYFNGRTRIDSLDDALVILGQDMLAKSILQAAVNNYFSQADNGYALCKGGLFYHALGTALISEKIAAMTGKAHASVAYTAGLLHDIGKVVLDRHIKKLYPLLYRGIQDEGRNILAVERKLFGIDHTITGGKLAEDWSFSPFLSDVIRYHHEPEKAKNATELAHIVYLAELLMSRFHTGLELERSDTGSFEKRLNAIGFTLSDLPDIIDFIPKAVFKESTDECTL